MIKIKHAVSKYLCTITSENKPEPFPAKDLFMGETLNSVSLGMFLFFSLALGFCVSCIVTIKNPF